MRAHRQLGVVLMAAVLMSCGPVARDATPDLVEPSEARDDDELHVDFERPLYRAGSRLFDAGQGWADAVVLESQPRALTLVAGAADIDRAVSIPPRCSDRRCLRALVELPDDDRLDPGQQDFVFGARVRLAADQTDTGSNIVQKGRYDTLGGQWKLQIDGADGHPSCVLQGNLEGTRESARLEAAQSVADDTWHSVSCQRSGDDLTITVDGSSETVAAELGAIANAEPVRIGASGPDYQDDQFHGDIDDVYFCTGECTAPRPTA